MIRQTKIAVVDGSNLHVLINGLWARDEWNSKAEEFGASNSKRNSCSWQRVSVLVNNFAVEVDACATLKPIPPANSTNPYSTKRTARIDQIQIRARRSFGIALSPRV